MSTIPLTAVSAGSWQLDPNLSTAGLTVSNFGFKRVQGTVPIQQATVQTNDSGAIESVHATLDLAGIDTGNARREKDLAKRHLLNTAEFPTISFDGAAGSQGVAGVLAVRGVTIPLQLEFQVSRRSADSVEVSATTGFDRAPLGMKIPRFLVGGWIDVEIKAVFRRR